MSAWSPEQIARRLPVDFADDATMRISHEAIYPSAVRSRSKRVAPRTRRAYLRTGRVLRMPRGAHARARQDLHLRDHDQPTSGGGSRSRRAGPLGRRPYPGSWQGSAIGTLVLERTTRFTLLLYLPRMAGHGHEARVKNRPALSAGHGAEAVRDAISRTIVTLPEQLRRSLTWDQGAEMAQHARLKIEAGVQSPTSAILTAHGSTWHQREH